MAEVKFLRTHLKKENINARVEFVPTTIWDLHVITKYLTDIEAQQSLKSQNSKVQEWCTHYFLFSNELMSAFDFPETPNTQHYCDLATSYLIKIDKYKIRTDLWSQALSEELQKIQSGSSSILHKMIKEEIDAGANYLIVLTKIKALAHLSFIIEIQR